MLARTALKRRPQTANYFVLTGPDANKGDGNPSAPGTDEEYKQKMGILRLRLMLFVAHAAFSILLIVRLLVDKKCPGQNFWYAQSDTMISWLKEGGSRMQPFLTGVADPKCISGKHGLCVQGIPDGVRVPYGKDDWMLGGNVHVVTLLLIFEWITASFALIYAVDAYREVSPIQTVPKSSGLVTLARSKAMRYAEYLALFTATAWNFFMAVIVTTASYVVPRSHIYLTWIFFFITFLVQSWFLMELARHEGNEFQKDTARIQARYLEYAQTAAALFISVVQVLSFTGTSATSLQCATLAIFVCNVLGATLQSNVKANMDSKDKIQVALHLLGSWAAFIFAWIPAMQSYRDMWDLIGTVPGNAKVAIHASFIILFIFYFLFGIIPTWYLYRNALMGNRRKVEDGAKHLAWWTLDSLSITVKLTIVGLLLFTDTMQPQATNDRTGGCGRPPALDMSTAQLDALAACKASLF